MMMAMFHPQRIGFVCTRSRIESMTPAAATATATKAASPTAWTLRDSRASTIKVRGETRVL